MIPFFLINLITKMTYAATAATASSVIDFAMWEKMMNGNIKLVPVSATELSVPSQLNEPDEWFVCSFCCQVVVDNSCFMVGTSCVCALCKADDELVDEFIEMNEISKEERRELLEIYALDDPEYRGDKKEEVVVEEIDCCLYENFKEETYNILYGEDASDGDE